MSQIITKQMLQSLEAGKPISGVLLLRTCTMQYTKAGKEYMVGLLSSEIDVPFKSWNNSTAFKELKENDYTNVISYIVGTVDDYGGQISIIIDKIEAVAGFTIDQFLANKYNVDAYWNALVNLIQAKVTPEAFEIAKKVMFENNEVIDKFKLEFAAKSHHDNCKGGLLAHTYKVVSNLNFILTQYVGIVGTDTKKIDLLYLGALFHDIGKIYEMHLGAYQTISVAKHQFIGTEIVGNFKSDIVEKFSSEFYYQLMSIILQHHGQFGEPPKTVAAYIIHKADMLDSDMTLLLQLMESPMQDSSGDKIKIDSDYLTLM